MRIREFEFGKNCTGHRVFGYELDNADNLSIRVINRGATLISVRTADKKGIREEITLGFNQIEAYEKFSPYFGATIGRVANRIGNGCFDLNQKTYHLKKNDGNQHHLHGGTIGFDKVLWDMRCTNTDTSATITLNYLSPHLEEGYPGNLNASVSYTITRNNELLIQFQAETDRACPVMLTNHAYWNLSGNNKTTVLAHVLKMDTDRYLVSGKEIVPTGEIAEVTGTVMDFTTGKAIGTDIEAVGGYDHFFIRKLTSGQSEKPLAIVTEPASGRILTLFSDQLGCQFYSGNFLNQLKPQGFNTHDGFCLETHSYPDAVNHPHFPEIVLQPGQIYRQSTRFEFSVQS